MGKRGSKFSLRVKISLTIVLLVFIFGGFVILTVGKLVNDAMVASKFESIDAQLTEQTHETESRLHAVRDAVDMAANTTEIVKYLEQKDRKQQDTKTLKFLTDFSLGRHLASLYVIDNKGLTLVSTDPTFVGNDFGFRDYVKKALAGESFTEMAIGSVTKKPGFYFSAPVKSSAGAVIGVLAAKLDPEFIFTDLDISKARGNGGDIMFVNGDGVVVYSTKPSFVYKSLSALTQENLNQIVIEKRYPGVEITPLDYPDAMNYVARGESNAKVVSVVDKFDNREELVGIDRVGDYPYFLVSESGKDDVLAAVSKIARIIAMVILGALALGVLVQVFFLRILLRPLEKLEEYATRVSEGKLDEEIVVESGDELQSLSESISNMVKSIKGIYANLEEEVKNKTAELSMTLAKFEEKNLDLEKTKKAILNVMEDLSEEKDKIGSEKNRIETILKSIGDGVFVTDTKGEVVMVNQAAEKITGFSSIEMYGKQYMEIFRFANEDDLEGKYPDFVGEAMEKGKTGSLLPHTVVVAKDGTRIPVLDSAAPLKSLDGRVFGCVVVVRDNTKERELEKNKDDFLSVTSHQLRTPLGSMRWNLEMLLGGDAGVLSSEAEEIAKQIYDGNIRMIGLVNDLLNVSRIDQGRVMDEPEETDLGAVMDETLKEMEPLAVERKVKISTDIDRKVGKLVIDKKRLREVIENLMSNAVKYNKKDGEVKVSLKGNEKSIEISISDTGMGIPKKDLGRLFSKFFRAENAVHSETEGTGLGLYVVKKFVEGWGGKLTVESELGKGSTFVITLPSDIKYKKVETKK